MYSDDHVKFVASLPEPRAGTPAWHHWKYCLKRLNRWTNRRTAAMTPEQAKETRRLNNRKYYLKKTGQLEKLLERG